MKIALTWIALASSVVVVAHAQNVPSPEDLDRALTQYTRQRADLISKLNASTMKTLEALKSQYMRGANLAAANQVQSKIDELNHEIQEVAPFVTPPVGAGPQAPAAKPGVAVALDPTGAAVRALISGSRWEWFDNPDLTRSKGKVYWHEFYKDGSASNSWGRSPTWEILPPNILHIHDPHEPRDWYFDIDVAKRVGLRNVAKDPSHNSMRYEKKVPTPPPGPKKN